MVWWRVPEAFFSRWRDYGAIMARMRIGKKNTGTGWFAEVSTRCRMHFGKQEARDQLSRAFTVYARP